MMKLENEMVFLCCITLGAAAMPGCQGASEVGVSLESQDKAILSASSLQDQEQTDTYNATIPSSLTDLDVPVTFPQYSGAGQLEKVVVTVGLTPIVSGYTNWTGSGDPMGHSSSCNFDMSLGFGVAGQGALSELTDTKAALVSFSVVSDDGVEATSTPATAPYTFTQEYDYPADSAMLQAFSGSGNVSWNVTESAWLEATCTGGSTTFGTSSAAGGSVTLAYTYTADSSPGPTPTNPFPGGGPLGL